MGDPLWQVTQSATRLRTSLGLAGDCPPGLAEATAALQALACDLVPAPEARRRRSRLWHLQDGLPGHGAGGQERSLPGHERPARAHPPGRGTPGPASARAVPVRELRSASRPATAVAPATASATPRTRTGCLTGATPIRDGRSRSSTTGGCASTRASGADRLPTVFRAGQEPFVAPSGGRMDEIIMAVRDCPSGALSFGFGDTEDRAETDWDNAREPAVEITRDGPYRITGGIELIDADGKPMPRNAGASLEHYALCRCGHSQNKPYCSGMHWYVGFRDPQPSAEPTLFEWAGGLGALTRMTRLLYEKHVAADPEVAAAFASMPPGYPEYEAARMSESFGGPAAAMATPATSGTVGRRSGTAATAGRSPLR